MRLIFVLLCITGMLFAGDFSLGDTTGMLVELKGRYDPPIYDTCTVIIQKGETIYIVDGEIKGIYPANQYSLRIIKKGVKK
jgi:hypothetical protein